MMGKLFVAVYLVLALSLPAKALELAAPTVPTSGAAWMPEQTQNLGEAVAEILTAALGRIRPDLREAMVSCTGVLAGVLALALLSAIPVPDIHNTKKRQILEGEVPSPIRKPSGCAFHNRCPHCMEVCKQVDPALAVQNTSNGHMVACHLYAEQQKKIQEEQAAAVQG